MSLYKELDYALKAIKNRQRIVYPGSVILGIPVQGPTDTECLNLANILRMEHFVGGLKQHREEIRMHNFIQVTVKLHLPWEQENEVYSCTTWSIVYVNDKNRALHYVSVSQKRTEQLQEEIWEHQ